MGADRKGEKIGWTAGWVGGGIHLGARFVAGISVPGKRSTGRIGDSSVRSRHHRHSSLLTLAAPDNAVLETHACALWLVFSLDRLGRMVLWRPGSHRAQLVESALAHPLLEPFWNTQQPEMVGLRYPVTAHGDDIPAF